MFHEVIGRSEPGYDADLNVTPTVLVLTNEHWEHCLLLQMLIEIHCHYCSNLSIPLLPYLDHSIKLTCCNCRTWYQTYSIMNVCLKNECEVSKNKSRNIILPFCKYSLRSCTIVYKCTICAQSLKNDSTVRDTQSNVLISYWKYTGRLEPAKIKHQEGSDGRKSCFSVFCVPFWYFSPLFAHNFVIIIFYVL